AEKQRREQGTLDAQLAATYSRSQMFLSRQLAQLHPELTMPMFSEVTYRLSTARPMIRQLLLQYLLPWLYNMELVDPNIQQMSPLAKFQYFCQNEPLSAGQQRREGWGSAEATEMVLNNLLYITAKIGDDHPKRWRTSGRRSARAGPTTSRSSCEPFIVGGKWQPTQLLLPYGQRVAVYMARARPDQLVEELMAELQTVESMNCTIERTETPPFFRLTSLRKTSNHS
ncbi:protein furry-like, partial [Pollicipes pollicipes]|uniref:protein furry-like n=1 Tax=Pollicipes pollicipes TaxID=41117 RepID=UPI00188598EA